MAACLMTRKIMSGPPCKSERKFTQEARAASWGQGPAGDRLLCHARRNPRLFKMAKSGRLLLTEEIRGICSQPKCGNVLRTPTYLRASTDPNSQTRGHYNKGHHHLDV